MNTNLLHLLRSVFALCFLLALPACNNLYLSSRPVLVEVRDGETGRPLPKATVTYSYLHGYDVFRTAPKDVVATTDPAGHATLEIISSSRTPNLMASAEGYLTYQYLGPTEQMFVSAAPASAPATAPATASVARTLYLYAAPPVAIEFVLPDNFRGSFRVHAVPSVQPSPVGQRSFSYVVPASGVVEVPLTELLRASNWAANVSARFVGGRPAIHDSHDLANPATEYLVAIRPLAAEIAPDLSHEVRFLIGTKADEAGARSLPTASGQ